MRKIFLVSLLIIFSLPSIASHIIGGEIRYEYISTNATGDSTRYKIILLLFKGDATGTNVAQLATSYVIGIFNNDNNSKIIGPSYYNDWTIYRDNPPDIQPVPTNISSCINNPPTLNYTYASYSMEIVLANNTNGYTVAYQTCCRQNGMQNVGADGANYMCLIPGTARMGGNTLNDSSPAFRLPVSVICQNAPFNLDFGATDPDGDSLVYRFCNAYNGGRATDAGFEDPDPPPYQSVAYINGHLGTLPLGSGATINSATGMISGTSPNAGNYVVCVCVDVFRNGRRISTHRKDLIVRVSPCDPIRANPDPGYTTCDGFNIQFDHSSAGANSVFWDFGVPGIDNDTSIINNPIFVYSDTGIYTVKFYINRGESCEDSTTIQMGIYPGFFPGFEAAMPFCTGVPVQFADTSFTRYGVIDSWKWDFGDPSTTTDESFISNPQYVYNTPGTYTVNLTVTNSKGCEKNVSKNITILPSPPLTLFNADTLICGRDSIRLSASSTGTISWQPNYRIIGANTASPTVYPLVPTTYYATGNLMGCTTTDSVRINPVLNFENFIQANPASICEEDTLTLTGTSNQQNVRWLWQPNIRMANAQNAVTKVSPLTTTTYTLTSYWGQHCEAQKQITIPVTPLAIPNAGPDTAYCIGQSGVTLQASGGHTYSWAPSTGLSSTNIPNPIAQPANNTTYIVSVGVNGCSKLRKDTIVVLARQAPALQMSHDTLICVIDTLQIQASGNGTVIWSPNYSINNLTAHQPLVSPDIPTRYYVTLTDIFGCFKKDSVMVDVRPDVTVNAGNDTTICRGDTMRINTTGDAVSYYWENSTNISNVDVKNPLIWPNVSTLYTVRANIGKCEKQSRIRVTVVNYPQPNAGRDTILCAGASVQLNASGGSIYLWDPPDFLSATTVPNPLVSHPGRTVHYTVTVSDTLGCPKSVKDTVTVRVIPPLNVHTNIHDTTIVAGQPINLSVAGAVSYLWTPATWLSSATVRTPIARPQDDIIYHVTGTDQYGCIGRDSVRFRVYTVIPGMYVPTAFTPNGDGNNDIIRPILIGMKSLAYFRVYNRYGEMVYSTSEQGKGWDGIYNGKPQDPGTFVWVAEGVTYQDKRITQKGYVVLIR